MMDFELDDVKYVHCSICGQKVPVNVNYPVDQLTCTRCYLEKKWRNACNDGLGTDDDDELSSV